MINSACGLDQVMACLLLAVKPSPGPMVNYCALGRNANKIWIETPILFHENLHENGAWKISIISSCPAAVIQNM